MSLRVLVVGAGTGVGNSVLRSRRTGDPDLVMIGGAHHDRFTLEKSTADHNDLVTSPRIPASSRASGT